MADLHFTPVYETARQALEITRDEYAACNYIQTWSAHPENRYPGWCDRSQEQMAFFIGMSSRGLRKMCERLIEADLIEQNTATRLYRITKKWFEAVLKARQEQSSGPEQSSDDTGTKFAGEAEPGSGDDGNKVPAHNKLNTKPNRKDSKANAGATISETIEFLNDQIGSDFKAGTKDTQQKLRARIAEGYTIDDFKLVIMYKNWQWANRDEMADYLQPSTLFRSTKFEGYLQAARRHFARLESMPAPQLEAMNKKPIGIMTPADLKGQLSQFYKENPGLWTDAKQYGKVDGKPQDWYTQQVLKFCARQVSRGAIDDTFAQYNARLMDWFLITTETDAPREQKPRNTRTGSAIKFKPG